MITLKKLRTLKESTRLRKYISILREFEEHLKNEAEPDKNYYISILNEITLEPNLPKRSKEIAKEPIALRSINTLRHTIMRYLNIEPSEWDFIAPLDKKEINLEKLGIKIYLDDIRSPFNLGSIFRTSECFGVSKVFLSKDSTSPSHNRALRTSMGCIGLVEHERSSLKNLEDPIFALELGGTPIDDFKFPETGTVIIGSEELGVSPEGLKRADNSLGRVTIPLVGKKSSLNVANATSILLQRWSAYLLKS